MELKIQFESRLHGFHRLCR